MRMLKETFKLVFNESYFKPNDIIINCTRIKYGSRFLKLLGFKFLYECMILDEPIKNGEYFEYTAKYIKTKLYWLRFKICNIKYKSK